MFKNNGPKVLLLDIETSPIIASVWSIWNQDVPLNMIEKDWSVLSYSAKLLGDKKMYYDDVRGQKDVNDDSKLLKGIWKLLDEADVIVTQNGKKFDIKKLNARFIINGMQPPSSFKHIDTKQIASKNFAFTSNKLEYMAQKLGLKQQKSKHKKFSGFELWRQCLANNLDAWKEMEHYNKQDVLTLEELYLKLRGWDNQGVNFKNIEGAFIYILSGLHFSHMAFGLTGLALVLRDSFKNRRFVDGFIVSLNPAKNTLAQIVTIFWHFLGFLWIALFCVFLIH
jgi:hypothetical protein